MPKGRHLAGRCHTFEADIITARCAAICEASAKEDALSMAHKTLRLYHIR